MVLIKDATEKAINTAILALNDDIEKVKASNSSSSSSGITEGETYNINISGNANTASKVKNALTLNVGGNATSYDGSSAKTVTIGSNAKLTVATTDTYTAASTTEYDGSTAKTATIYTPDQEVNKTSSPTFNTVTAALNGNATSADKVNNVLTLNVGGNTTSYDGSEAKTSTIYTPDQEVNKTSSPTFNTVTAALNGNATSADKVNNVLTLNVGGTTTSYDGSEAKTVTIGSNAKLTVATTDTYTAASTTEYDGSTAKTSTIYTPDQEVNKTSSPTFAKISYSGNTGIVDLSSQISWVSSLVDSVFLRAIKVNGVVYLYGGMTYKGSVSIPTQIIGTGLPSAYRPMTDVFSCCEWYSSSANSTGAWRSLVKTTGEVGIYEVGTSNGSFLALSISYPVAS